MALSRKNLIPALCGYLVLFVVTSDGQTDVAKNQAEAAAVKPDAERKLSVAEVMGERIAKAKAFIAVRNYPAAIYELEAIKSDTTDQSVHAVTNVLLMNSYLEAGRYDRANEMLEEFFRGYKSNNANAEMFYSSIAGQVVKGSRAQIDRYRGLGLNVADRNLPLQAVTDIEKMRETLELVITQAKEISTDAAKTPVALPLLEEATVARGILARDEYDVSRWRNEIADIREEIAQSQSKNMTTIAEAATTEAAAETSTPERVELVPVAVQPEPESQSIPAAEKAASTVPEKTVATTTRPVKIVQSAPRNVPPAAVEPDGNEDAPSKADVAEESSTAEETSVPTDNGIQVVGPLIGFATNQQAPVYPSTARQLRQSGVVRVDILVDENGEVEEIQKISGPSLLQPAARNAIMKWKFRPIEREGRPVKASGFIYFNFSL